ncbi:hypothetical protein JCM21531_531 [Acetivibrio straminisolvens JCM 21531]|uniref:Uncharacterized protein n=1 Tax=Acetivibrio straminisolvens JCM 21531 TaxID=1294263 RepID=W4V236_9FIRM|nr:hypothetical protein JCM21531_531 [Acetivibrio straminisolvens JCM 21531]
MSFLQDLFLAVVNMSITASYVAIGVILLRFLFKSSEDIFLYSLDASSFPPGMSIFL